ncbi:MAG: type 1 glutamine amidotransferase [Actinobacteria bacterium]|nr:type 1 glutamine amidotransferase [Actinomycetota bacterium]
MLVIENEPADPVGVLGEWLLEAGVRIEVVRPYVGDAIPAAFGRGNPIRGLIVLGGAAGALDDELAPWLPATRDLLASAVRNELPTLGICLGAQLLAVANGGRVKRSPEGPEYGASLVAKRAAAATDPLFGPLPITPDVIQWHVDAITRLPPDAVELASSPVCAVQAYRLGRLAWGIQFHIETTPAIVRQWAETDADELADYDLDTILTRSDAVHFDVADVWQPFAAGFAAIVKNPDSVPHPRPIRLSTAEPVTDPAEIRAALAAELGASRSLPWPVPGDSSGEGPGR